MSCDLHLNYKYKVGNKEYVSPDKKVAELEATPIEEPVARAKARYLGEQYMGKQFEVQYDPDNPSESLFKGPKEPGIGLGGGTP